MSRNEIIAMAREADLIDFRDADDDPHTKQMVEFFERFAALVAAKEREACAALCDAYAHGWKMNPGQNPEAGFVASINCSAAIRARGKP